ncbi:hypothetical protein [Jiangella anatolica]|nr:hypothetical protein [Jiangella anatolica]
MEAVVVLLFAALAGAAFLAVRHGRFAAQRRHADLRGDVRSRGWGFSASGDPQLTRRWPGPPFHPGGGVARPVVSGTHRGRSFVAFEYVYEITPSPTAKTAIPHRRLVITISLPGSVPDLAVTRKNAVARVLDRPVPDVAGEHRHHRVACADPLFASTVLQPTVVEWLDAGPPWDWRFAGDTMIGYQPGRLTPERLLSGLDAFSDVLDRIPAEAWRHGSGPVAG